MRGGSLIPEEKSKDEARNELEEIEILMEKLKGVASRQERRRLLAQFNKKQAIMYQSRAQFGTRNQLMHVT